MTIVTMTMILTVHRMLILPKPQHPSMQTGSGLLVGALCTRCTAAGVDCWLFCIVPACLTCAVERPGRNNAVRSATCCPRIPFIVGRSRFLPCAEMMRWFGGVFVARCVAAAGVAATAPVAAELLVPHDTFRRTSSYCSNTTTTSDSIFTARSKPREVLF